MQTLNTSANQIWKLVSQVHIFLYFKNKDSDSGKLATDAFKELEQKHSKRLSVQVHNAKLQEEHMMPMMVVQDRNSGEIISQVFNFVDILGGKQNLTLQGVEKFLKVRGILESQEGSHNGFETIKEQKENMYVIGSSYLQDQLDMQTLEELNKYLEETERLTELEIDIQTVNYKERILETFTDIEDPFQREIQELNYDQNPSDPTSLLKNIIITPYLTQ